MARILIVEDELLVAKDTRNMLQTMDYDVIDIVPSGAEAIEKAQDLKPDLILMDINLKGKLDGIDAAKKINEILDIPIIFCTAYAEHALIQRAAKTNSLEYVMKPFEAKVLYSSIEVALNQHNLMKQLKTLSRFTSKLLNTISYVTIGLDKNEKITHWNRMAETVFGITGNEIIGELFLNVDIPWDNKLIRDKMIHCKNKNCEQTIYDMPFKKPNGRNGFMNITIASIQEENVKEQSLIICCADITEYKIMQDQLAQSQKLESIGQLAAGIAHEINTPIQYVGDNTLFLKNSFHDQMELSVKYQSFLQAQKTGTPDLKMIGQLELTMEELDIAYLLEEIPKAIEQSLEGVHRMSQIVRAMKDFSHPGGGKKEKIDINKAIETTITISRNEWEYLADLNTDFDESLPFVPCLHDELNQVILNLIVNASHTIEDATENGSKGKGVITIKTHLIKDYAEIRISDTGTRIPEKICDQVFDPFFTTKKIGKGTGQGLAISHNVIVNKHGGSLTFESNEGQGTTFIIRLPLEEVS